MLGKCACLKERSKTMKNVITFSKSKEKEKKMKEGIFIERAGQPSPNRERDRLNKWPRIGIRLEKVMAVIGHMEDLARLLREDEGYAGMYTIEEQIQRASDNLRFSIRAFENMHEVKVEIFTPYSPFEDYSEAFLPYIKKPEENA
jgi:hypothetical protein